MCDIILYFECENGGIFSLVLFAYISVSLIIIDLYMFHETSICCLCGVHTCAEKSHNFVANICRELILAYIFF